MKAIIYTSNTGSTARYAKLLGQEIVKIIMACFKYEKGRKAVTLFSVGLSVSAVLFLTMAREPYAVTVTFLLLLAKGGLLYKHRTNSRE